MLSFHEAAADDPPRRVAARGTRGRLPRAGFAGLSRPGRLGPCGGVVPGGPASTIGSRSPTSPPASFASCRDGTGTVPSASCGAASSWRPTPPPPTSGLASSSTFAAARTTRPCALRRAEELDPLSLVVSALVGLHRAFGGEHAAELAHARAHARARPEPVPRPRGGG